MSRLHLFLLASLIATLTVAVVPLRYDEAAAPVPPVDTPVNAANSAPWKQQDHANDRDGLQPRLPVPKLPQRPDNPALFLSENFHLFAVGGNASKRQSEYSVSSWLPSTRQGNVSDVNSLRNGDSATCRQLFGSLRSHLCFCRLLI